MAKDPATEAPARRRARKTSAFQPTREQRLFVAAAAGLGVPRSVICQMLPGARPGETVSIPRDTLRREFDAELRDGLKLVMALVETRVFQRALSQDDRSALAAQMALLNARGGWKSPVPHPVPAEPDPDFDPARLTREEREELRRLLEKANPGLAEECGMPPSRQKRGSTARNTV